MSTLITDEMVTAAQIAYDVAWDCDNPNGSDVEWMRAALTAIEPALEKLIGEREDAAAHAAQSAVEGRIW